MHVSAVPGVPLNFEIEVDGPRTLTFSWDHPPGLGANTYQLSCDPQPAGFPKLYNSNDFNERGVEAAESGFTPSTIYNCSVFASSGVGVGPASLATATTLDDGTLIKSVWSALMMN